jgi:hypothetical protein
MGGQQVEVGGAGCRAGLEEGAMAVVRLGLLELQATSLRTCTRSAFRAASNRSPSFCSCCERSRSETKRSRSCISSFCISCKLRFPASEPAVSVRRRLISRSASSNFRFASLPRWISSASFCSAAAYLSQSCIQQTAHLQKMQTNC